MCKTCCLPRDEEPHVCGDLRRYNQANLLNDPLVQEMLKDTEHYCLCTGCKNLVQRDRARCNAQTCDHCGAIFCWLCKVQIGKVKGWTGPDLHLHFRDGGPCNGLLWHGSTANVAGAPLAVLQAPGPALLSFREYFEALRLAYTALDPQPREPLQPRCHKCSDDPYQPIEPNGDVQVIRNALVYHNLPEGPGSMLDIIVNILAVASYGGTIFGRRVTAGGFVNAHKRVLAGMERLVRFLYRLVRVWYAFLVRYTIIYKYKYRHQKVMYIYIDLYLCIFAVSLFWGCCDKIFGRICMCRRSVAGTFQIRPDLCYNCSVSSQSSSSSRHRGQVR